MTNLAFAFPGGMEWFILLALGVLIFGRRLPEVGRSLGRSIVEFKKGIKGIEDEIESASSEPKLSESSKPIDLASDQRTVSQSEPITGEAPPPQPGVG